MVDATKSTPPAFIRIKGIKARYGISSSTTVYGWIKNQGFPPPVKLSPSCSAWPLSKVLAWEDQRAAAQ